MKLSGIRRRTAVCSVALSSSLILPALAWAEDGTTTATAARTTINWQKDIATAQDLARAQKKLVVDFFLLGNLNAPDC